MEKRCAALFLAVLFLGIFLRAAIAGDLQLVASQNSDRYHRADCKIVKKIRKEDIAPDLKTPEDYIAAGYNPCKKCYPPTVSKEARN